MAEYLRKRKIMAECKCFNTSHEHHKGRACKDTAEQNGYCRCCNDAGKKDFGKPVSAESAPRSQH